jgi:hypothetical protein
MKNNYLKQKKTFIEFKIYKLVISFLLKLKFYIQLYLKNI